MSRGRENLSDRELEVALLAASGLSQQEIAVRLSVSGNTVRTHIRHVYDKLGVHNRIQLVRTLNPLPKNHPNR